MRYFSNDLNGPACTVTVSAREVENFAMRWPCSGLSDKPIWFSFANNGDLVDCNDSKNHPNADGAALSALCDDAKEFANKRRQFI